MYAGAVFLFSAMLLAAVFNLSADTLAIFVLPLIAVLVPVALVANFFCLRCPRCQGNLASMILHQGWFFVSPRIRYCPYCGGNLDEELPAAVH
jgi:hypothetical protein